MCLPLSQEYTILADESLAAEYEVLRALAEACSSKDISLYETCALLRYEPLEILIFAYTVIVRTEVEDKFCSHLSQRA